MQIEKNEYAMTDCFYNFPKRMNDARNRNSR